MDEELEFEWSEIKARINRRDHGVPMSAGRAVFADPRRLEEDDPFSPDEYRYSTTGRSSGLLLTVTFSEPLEGVVRLISVRPAAPSERRNYNDPLRQN